LTGRNRRASIAAMTTQSFAIKTARDLHAKCAFELQQLRDGIDRTQAMYTCVNLAISLWHMADWTWHELTPGARDLLSKAPHAQPNHQFARFKEWLRENPDLDACACVANASKHVTAEKNGNVKRSLASSDVSAEETCMGSITLTVSGSYGPDAWDYLIYVDGDRHRTVDIFTRAHAFWASFLASNRLA
jgi:hypothetical protein